MKGIETSVVRHSDVFTRSYSIIDKILNSDFAELPDFMQGLALFGHPER